MPPDAMRVGEGVEAQSLGQLFGHVFQLVGCEVLAEHRGLEQPPTHLADLQVSEDGRVEFWHGRADYLESNKVSIRDPWARRHAERSAAFRIGRMSRVGGPVVT